MSSPGRETAAPGGEPVRREGGRRRRREILQAVLRLIARDGIRAVRHRAVAEEAGVPLAATTYYFTDLAQLLRQAFELFAEERRADVASLRGELAHLLERAAGDVELFDVVTDRLSSYVIAQAAQREDRAVETAFRHEAQREPGLARLISEQDELFLDYSAELLGAVGSAEPVLDARITLGLILHLESQAAFGGMSPTTVARIIERHIDGILERARAQGQNE